MKLEGKVAVVTGAGSGIGKATALLFAREGARCLLFGRGAARLEDTARAIREQGGEAVTAVGSVTAEPDVVMGVRVAKEVFGRIDILVNNAGVSGFGARVHETTDDDWNRIMGTNLHGAYRWIRAVIPLFLEQRGGVIVNVSSTHGQLGLPGDAIYSASKGGMISLTKSVALEYAKLGIRANCVCPAAVETELIAPAMKDPRTRDWIIAAHPIGRLGRPEEVALAILYLASSDAEWVTGSVLTLDGGLTSQ